MIKLLRLSQVYHFHTFHCSTRTAFDAFVIQVWDAVTGQKQFTFEGHEAAVYSVCPHHKENIQVEFYAK